MSSFIHELVDWALSGRYRERCFSSKYEYDACFKNYNIKCSPLWRDHYRGVIAVCRDRVSEALYMEFALKGLVFVHDKRFIVVPILKIIVYEDQVIPIISMYINDDSYDDERSFNINKIIDPSRIKFEKLDMQVCLDRYRLLCFNTSDFPDSVKPELYKFFDALKKGKRVEGFLYVDT